LGAYFYNFWNFYILTNKTMSYGYNNGWGGGCGCGNTVQYAPPACNPNFPTYCTSLGQGNIVRLVGEDSAFCKYTVPTFVATATNTKAQSILTYNNVGNVSWGDGSSSNPIYIAPPDNTATGQAYQSPVYGTTGVSLQATTATGQLVELTPASSLLSKAQFPVVAPSGSTTTWGTIDNIIPNDGVVYRSSGTVAEASLGSTGQVLTMSGGVPVFQTPPTNAFIDARSVNISYASVTSLNVTFSQLVLSNGTNQIAVSNSSTYTLNLSNYGLANTLDTGSLTNNAYYYVFAIYNSTTSTLATLASLSPTAPTLPTGYSYFRLIGLFRTNNSSQVDALYNQNGRAVNLGQTANVVVSSQSTQATNKYWSGSISYAPYQYVDKAFFRFSLVGTSTSQTANVIISNVAAGSTGGTQPALATTNEIYGAFIVAPAYGTSTNSVYGSTTCVVPNNSTSYFNIYTTAILGTGDSFALQISGYELSFL